MATLHPLFVITFFVSFADSTCTCGGCIGPNNAYCVKNYVQCKSGKNDNPLITDVYKVSAAYKKVIKQHPGSFREDPYYVASRTLFVGANSKEVCAYVCQELDNCVAVEYQLQYGSQSFTHRMACSYAYACDSTIPWHPHLKGRYKHGILLDTAHHAKKGSLSVDQGKDYVPYSDYVALTFDYYFYFAVAVVAFLFFGIGIFLGLAIKKYPKQVQYPQL